ncbi:MAG: four helix bundle protein [Chitinophagales bacterium]|nr:four helix bundle protein [Chitinophagales bacterium]
MFNNQNTIIKLPADDSSPKTKKFDLEQCTFEFAGSVRKFIRALKMDLPNIEDAKQLVRSSGSVGANYIEANEALSKKDFLFRVKISRKEVKETRYWLMLISTKNEDNLENTRTQLIRESGELLKIFSSIISKTEVQMKAEEQVEKV